MRHTTPVLLLKLLLSALVAYALVYPFLQPEPVGLAKELAVLGLPGAVALGLVFFFLVVLYAKDLHAVLHLLAPGKRRASPQSVWWMLVLPYNFIEDFFIIHHVTASLRCEAQTNSSLAGLKSLGAVSGFGWCAAQIGSLIPNELGNLFALLALALWLMHWRLMRRVIAILRAQR